VHGVYTTEINRTNVCVCVCVCVDVALTDYNVVKVMCLREQAHDGNASDCVLYKRSVTVTSRSYVCQSVCLCVRANVCSMVSLAVQYINAIASFPQ